MAKTAAPVLEGHEFGPGTGGRAADSSRILTPSLRGTAAPGRGTARRLLGQDHALGGHSMNTVTTIIAHGGTFGILACLLVTEIAHAWGTAFAERNQRQDEERRS